MFVTEPLFVRLGQLKTETRSNKDVVFGESCHIHQGLLEAQEREFSEKKQASGLHHAGTSHSSSNREKTEVKGINNHRKTNGKREREKPRD